MKTIKNQISTYVVFRYRFIVMIFIGLMFLFSCTTREYDNETVINADGSCERNITLKSEDASAFKHPFSFLIDSSWKVEKDTTSKKRLLKAQRKFNNVDEMNNFLIDTGCNWSNIKHDYHLNKRFRWFYSYYDYSERYARLNPFNKIPVSDYLSKDELLLMMEEETDYLAGRDSAEIEKIKEQIIDKVGYFFGRTMFESFYETLLQAVDTLKSDELTKDKVKADKKYFIERIKKVERKTGDFPDIGEFDKMIKLCDTIFKSNVLSRNKIIVDRVFTAYKEKCKKVDKLSSVYGDKESNSVKMPGLIIDTNAKNLIGNKVSWKYNLFKSLFKDYEIKVTSRVINVWAFIVSGIVIVLALIGIIVGHWRRRTDI
jgi:hypothetical protein